MKLARIEYLRVRNYRALKSPVVAIRPREMTDHALPNDTFSMTKQLPRIVLRDTQRLQQKRHIIEVKEKMRVARGSRRGSAPEIPWISEKIATLPLDRWVVESPEDGTWFFKVVLNGGLRANIQVDRDDDAFVSIHRDGASVGLATGGLKQVTTALMRLCYNR